MKIAYVYGAFVSRWVKGGVEKRIYEISKRLVERGYEVHWFEMKWGRWDDDLQCTHEGHWRLLY